MRSGWPSASNEPTLNASTPSSLNHISDGLTGQHNRTGQDSRNKMADKHSETNMEAHGHKTDKYIYIIQIQ